ncbi:amidase [Sandarakinorhabdus sp.]|uniref:amidase n=1 Tax=Sandarakinorhabdus sp. TaxID=1916663 RepID=UPI00286DA848|nr:amidase [Sandarakinorhabdus sp.]
MTTSDTLAFASIAEVGAQLRAGTVTSAALTDMMLARIAARDGHFHSYVTVTADRARAAAARADADLAAGLDHGPLHGIPVAVKDLCAIAGVPQTGGMAFRRDAVSPVTAFCVARLDAAGAVILGTLNLTEGAMAGYHRSFAVPVNPWGKTLWPGGSSSGSGVAVAAGLCFAAIGTDTGGSIRFPALANGVVGLKPSYGRVSRADVLELAGSLDHIGALARHVGDAALLVQAMAGADPADPTSLAGPAPDMMTGIGGAIAGLRLGVDRRYNADGTAPEVVAAIEAALARFAAMGATIVDVTMPADTESMVPVWFALCSHEAVLAHASTWPSSAADYGDYFRDFLSFGSSLDAASIASARAARADYNQRFAAVLAGCDALVAPAGGITFEMDIDLYGGMAATSARFNHVRMVHTVPADFAGTPSLTLPCGVSDDGRPVALQLMGAAGAEALLCRIGQAFEQNADWCRAYEGLPANRA